MKNVLIFQCAAFAATIVAGTAFGTDHPTTKFKPFYAKVGGGYEAFFSKSQIKGLSDISFDNKWSNGFAGRFSVGYQFTDKFAAEFEPGIFYHKGNVIYGIFANCQYNLATDSKFSPYIKAGLGYKHLVEDYQDMRLKLGFPAAAAGVGITYNALNNMFIDIGYTFSMSLFHSPKVTLSANNDISAKAEAEAIENHVQFATNTHTIALGIGFRF